MLNLFCDYLGVCVDVSIDCCHGVHPVAIDALLLWDWPLLTVGQKEVLLLRTTPQTHTHRYLVLTLSLTLT